MIELEAQNRSWIKRSIDSHPWSILNWHIRYTLWTHICAEFNSRIWSLLESQVWDDLGKELK